MYLNIFNMLYSFLLLLLISVKKYFNILYKSAYLSMYLTGFLCEIYQKRPQGQNKQCCYQNGECVVTNDLRHKHVCCLVACVCILQTEGGLESQAHRVRLEGPDESSLQRYKHKQKYVGSSFLNKDLQLFLML